MKVLSSSLLKRVILGSTLVAAVFFGSALESEAGTRFSNRKSRINQRGSRGQIEQTVALPAHGVAYRASSGGALRLASAPQAAVTVSEPKPARKGFFARLREKRGERQAEIARRNRSSEEATLPAQTLSAKIDRQILAKASSSSTRVVVDISKQRAYLLVGGEVAVDTPVSTARPGKYTPRGTFSISQRVPTGKVSTIYGVEMPYWMRLGNSVYGMHAGYLPGYPASAGCIRLPSNVAPTIFSATHSGTQVSIYSSWNG